MSRTAALWSGALPAANQMPVGYALASGFYIQNNARSNSATQRTFAQRLHVKGRRVAIKILKNGVADQTSSRLRLNVYSAPGDANDRTNFKQFSYVDIHPVAMAIGSYGIYEFNLPEGDNYILVSIYYHFEIMEVTEA